jgi:hypothetical protein
MTDWDEAEAYVRSLIADTKDTTIHGPTIADCVRRFLDSHKENIGHRALAHHRLTLTRLEDFAKSRNKLFMRDLTVVSGVNYFFGLTTTISPAQRQLLLLAP